MPGPTVPAAICGLALLLLCLTAEADGVAAPQIPSAPRINYMLHCQGCHLPDGSGTPEKVPALRNTVGRFLHVAGGREYLIQVPGTAQSALTDAEVAAVLNWILENFSKEELPADFAPYSTVEVTRLRRQPLADVSAVRAGLVARMSNREAKAAAD
jgi:mono/diheme cytochrome c family protein